MSKRVAIGIDLGTTYSCVGVLRDGKVDIIINEKGSRITPSCVAFTDQEKFVGDSAKAQGSVNPKNTVFEAKRLIGRRFADATVQDDMKQWPFEVLDDNGAPKIRVQFKKTEKILTPEEISAMVLMKLKAIAETKIGKEVQDAVITVPAYFNDSQRQATIDAGKIAGLNVLSIINEPTAAALAYGFDNKKIVTQKVLVFDLGGGTFDVSIISINGKNFEVMAVGGDTHLGGGDFDSRLVDHFLKIIKGKHHKDISQDRKALCRLRKACEDVKICLSGESLASIDIACLFDGKDFRAKISRKRFEELCSDLFNKTIEHVTSVVKDSGMNKIHIQEVILVGGSSRIPKIQELLSAFFDGKKLNATINPDEAVAYGAAVKAALASGENTIEEITLADVVPLSLGMESRGDEMITFIKRNTRIPTTVVQNNWTTAGNFQTLVGNFQTLVDIRVHEGERVQASNNCLLGNFIFDIGEKAIEGVTKLTFTFEVDTNGVLHVTGTNAKTGSSNGITITSNKGRLTKMEIEKMVQEAKTSNNPGGLLPVDAGPAKEALESYCFRKIGEANVLHDRTSLSAAERDSVVGWCNEAIQWLDFNDDLTKEDYDRKLRQLGFKCAPILMNVRQATTGTKRK